MTVTTYTTRVTIQADRKITVEVPGDMPVGEAEVTICAGPAPEPERRARSRKVTTGADLLEWMRTRKPMPPGYVPRTKEQIDAELRAMRDEWDD